jgi:hypothetical protein
MEHLQTVAPAAKDALTWKKYLEQTLNLLLCRQGGDTATISDNRSCTNLDVSGKCLLDGPDFD